MNFEKNKKTSFEKFLSLAFALVFALALSLSSSPSVFAANTRSYSLSPMNQTIKLTPGEDYEGSFKINNPSGNPDFSYRLEISPFWVSDSYDAIFESHGNYNLITNWISLEETTGTVPAGKSKTVTFTVKTPVSATPGGQYMVIRVASRDGSTTETANGTRAAYSMAHVLYAEVEGEGINRSGTVEDASLPGVVIGNKKLSATSKVKNSGNTLGTVSATFEAYPLFSNTLKYSNLDSPETYKILPDSSRNLELEWKDAPKIGIYKLILRVSYNDEELLKKDGFTLILPVWFIIVVVLLIVGLIALIIIFKKRNKKNAEMPPVPQSIVEEQ